MRARKTFPGAIGINAVSVMRAGRAARRHLRHALLSLLLAALSWLIELSLLADSPHVFAGLAHVTQLIAGSRIFRGTFILVTILLFLESLCLLLVFEKSARTLLGRLLFTILAMLVMWVAANFITFMFLFPIMTNSLSGFGFGFALGVNWLRTMFAGYHLSVDIGFPDSGSISLAFALIPVETSLVVRSLLIWRKQRRSPIGPHEEWPSG